MRYSVNYVSTCLLERDQPPPEPLQDWREKGKLSNVTICISECSVCLWPQFLLLLHSAGIDKLHTSFTSHPEPFKVKDFLWHSRMSSSSSFDCFRNSCLFFPHSTVWGPDFLYCLQALPLHGHKQTDIGESWLWIQLLKLKTCNLFVCTAISPVGWKFHMYVTVVSAMHLLQQQSALLAP